MCTWWLLLLYRFYVIFPYAVTTLELIVYSEVTHAKINCLLFSDTSLSFVGWLSR